MQISDLLFGRYRRETFGAFILVGFLALILVWLVYLAKPISHDHSLDGAARAVHEHYTANPPYGVWTFGGVRITKDKRIMVNVNVTVTPHATFIKTRNKRVRYSYMKLVCPEKNAPVQKWLKGKKLWIDLNFHGETLLEAGCPKNPRGGTLPRKLE